MFERELAKMADALTRAYERGRDDERRRVAAIFAVDEPKPARERARSLRGAVAAMVARELGLHGGLTVDQLMEAKQGAHEQSIARSSVRGELRRGEKAGKYTESGGLWFLTPPA